MITGGLCTAAKRDFLMGVHQQGDDYRIALYTTEANLSPLDVEFYTSVGEVQTKGYTAGGKSLQGYVCRVEGAAAMLGWEHDPQWQNVTIRAAGALIYNASRDNRALAVIQFDEVTTSSNGNFRVRMPPVDFTNAPICIE